MGLVVGSRPFTEGFPPDFFLPLQKPRLPNLSLTFPISDNVVMLLRIPAFEFLSSHSYINAKIYRSTKEQLSREYHVVCPWVKKPAKLKRTVTGVVQ